MKKKILAYCPIPALVCMVMALISGVIHGLIHLSPGFSDGMNRTVSAFVRMVLAKITNIVPFSLAETLLLCIPLLLFVIIRAVVRIPATDKRGLLRVTFSLLGVLCYLYAGYVLGFAACYRGTSLADKVGLERKNVTASELADTAEYLKAQLDTLLPEVPYRYNSSSVMPYTMDEMNEKLASAYEKAAKTYDFLPCFRSRIKYVLLSEPMTYTHISGVYTYFTGEANISVAYPTYTIPYTAAHELAHQRGIGPEDEANFMAFLVCIDSDDPYIRYSAYMNMLEYVLNALYASSPDAYSTVVQDMDLRLRYETNAYNIFYDKIRDSVASKVTDAVNDTYLKIQGQSEGSRSYGMVVDLTVAYCKKAMS